MWNLICLRGLRPLKIKYIHYKCAGFLKCLCNFWTIMATITIDFQLCFIFILLWFFSLFCFYAFFFKKAKDFSLPPSPPSIPIIGHLHLLLSFPFFRSFHKLSSKYGPLLYLRVFNSPIVVVSSGSMAYEVFRTHDQNFPTRDRLPPVLEKSLLFGSNSFTIASCGDYWRFMKKLLLTNLLGTQALERTRLIREEEIKTFRAMLFDKAAKNEAVDVGKEILKVTNNIICRMIMGRRCSEDNGEAEQVRDLVTISLSLMGKLLLANTLGRLLKKLTGFSLFEKDLMEVSMKYDVVLEKIIKEHEENPNKKDDGDMMDVLLEVCADQNAKITITKNHIKSLFVELFVAGSDTIAQTTQWTMAELINHPEILKKLRDEIESVVGKTRFIQESDLSSLPYLQAVVKEGFRLHPPTPVVLRNSTEGCKIGGFYIPENTTVIVNTYAVMRDPNSWENADEFQPQRFMVSPLKEKDEREYLSLRYIPFGGGRRGCTGSHLAYIFNGVAIGTMVQCFDWKIDGDKVNMEDTGIMTVIKAHPLKSTPVARIDPLTSCSSEDL